MAANNSAIQALVNSGADATQNMFDILVKFPWASEQDRVVTTRCSAFEPPEMSNPGYDVSYHGQKMKRPSTAPEFNRTFTLSFRLDAAYALYGEFVTWAETVGDMVNGGVANWPSALGQVTVVGLSGAYSATAVADSANSYYDDEGKIKSDAADNPKWRFFDVWVSKVGQPKFSGDSGEALTYDVEFQFGDCDYPFYNLTDIAGTGKGGAFSS